nr:immunoglobulin heavy chain junction region [Macaca mulatta]MOY22461.1 immunoglobulin heavy chain junction region [Macaca mulatta]
CARHTRPAVADRMGIHDW